MHQSLFIWCSMHFWFIQTPANEIDWNCWKIWWISLHIPQIFSIQPIGSLWQRRKNIIFHPRPTRPSYYIGYRPRWVRKWTQIWPPMHGFGCRGWYLPKSWEISLRVVAPLDKHGFKKDFAFVNDSQNLTLWDYAHSNVPIFEIWGGSVCTLFLVLV